MTEEEKILDARIAIEEDLPNAMFRKSRYEEVAKELWLPAVSEMGYALDGRLEMNQGTLDRLHCVKELADRLIEILTPRMAEDEKALTKNFARAVGHDLR